MCPPDASANSFQKALKDRGIDKMVEDARADNKENDAEFMKSSMGARCELRCLRLSGRSLTLARSAYITGDLWCIAAALVLSLISSSQRS